MLKRRRKPARTPQWIISEALSLARAGRTEEARRLADELRETTDDSVLIALRIIDATIAGDRIESLADLLAYMSPTTH
jgi:hypothetical protein